MVNSPTELFCGRHVRKLLLVVCENEASPSAARLLFARVELRRMKEEGLSIER